MFNSLNLKIKYMITKIINLAIVIVITNVAVLLLLFLKPDVI